MKRLSGNQWARGSEVNLLKRLSQKKLLIWLVIVLVSLVVASFLGSRGGLKDYPPYASNSPSPTGSKALFTYIKDQGIKTSRWYHRPEHLSEEENTLLFMIEPFFQLNEEELAHYKEMMEKGGRILLFSDNPRGLFDLDLGFTDIYDEEGDLQYGERSYSLAIDPMESIKAEEDDEALLYNQESLQAIERSYGEGSLIVVRSSSILINQNILEEEHAEFITSLFKDVYQEGYQVKFDEYIHESKTINSYVRAYPFWFLVLLIQGAILLILYLLYKGKRFGPIYRPREDYVRFSDESIVALASWHMKGKRYQDSLRIQADYVKQVLYKNWSIPYQLSWLDSEELLKKKWLRPGEDIEGFVRDLSLVLREDHLNKNEYIKWSKRLDDLRKEVEAS